MSDLPTDYTKQLLALLAAAFCGIVIGVVISVSLVPDVQMLGGRPTWMGEAEFVGSVCAFGAAMAAAGWMYIDYRYTVKA